MSNSLPVAIASDQSAVPVSGTFWQTTQPVSGTFWQTTQPVSLASLPSLATGSNTIGAVTQSGTWNIGSITTLPALVAGSATIGKVDILGNAGATLDGAAGSPSTQCLTIQGNSSGTAVPVSGTFWQTTQPVSIAAIVQTNIFAATVSASCTRVSNTTTYTANTGWNTATSGATVPFTWASVGTSNGENIAITGIDIYSSANPTTKLQGNLWLFNTTPGTVIQDDATFTIASSDFANLTAGSFGGIPFLLTNNQASGAANSGVSLQFGPPLVAALASGSTTLYGMVEVVNAYVPASAEKLTVILHTQAIN
jgi:hypothetical protein